jgi:hypothetical protein
VPSEKYIRGSLAFWRRRHKLRQSRLDAAHVRNDKAGIAKWHALLAEAGRNIRMREAQLRKLKPAVAPVDERRKRIAAAALQSAANYRKQPWAYHYLAGGVANTEIMKPTPRYWRSDCSQHAVNCDRIAGVPCPGSGSYLYSNTVSMVQGQKRYSSPAVGRHGLYGSSFAPHHVETCVSVNPLVFVGHGTQPIDSTTPGLPNYYIDPLD